MGEEAETLSQSHVLSDSRSRLHVMPALLIEGFCKGRPSNWVMRKKELVYQLQIPPRVIIRKGGTALFLRPGEIDWIEAKGLYTIFHTGQQQFPIRENISHVESRLDHKIFVRIHRSAIINIHRIREIQSWFRGEYKVILMNGTELTSSRSFKDRLMGLIRVPLVPEPTASPAPLSFGENRQYTRTKLHTRSLSSHEIRDERASGRTY